MKRTIQLFIFIFISQVIWAQVYGDDWNNRELGSYANDVEVARVTLTFKPGFETSGHTDFLGYIDPNLPYNGGTPVNDGEFDLNYIRVFQPLGHNSTSTLPDHNSLDYSLWSENISYFDGLGRRIQKIGVKASAYGNDIVQPILYDYLGRTQKEYMPYAIAQAGNNGAGGYRPTSLAEAQTFYANYYGDGDGVRAFTQNKFDGSPLSRIINQSAPGEAWKMEGGKVKEFKYETNIPNNIHLYEVNENGELVSNGYYSANSLYKVTSIDEDINSVVEYKNSLEQVILKVGELSTETYYVYDDFGLLRYVIPPLASDAFAGLSGTIGGINNEQIKNLCYYYEYDNRKRMKLKKIPGAEKVYLVYNKIDNLILSQDGEQRKTYQWTFIKYDELSRPIISGIYNYNNPSSQEDMQIHVNQASQYCFEIIPGNNGYSNQAYPILDDLDIINSFTYYDNYDALQLELNPEEYLFKSNEIDFYYPKTEKTATLSSINKTRVLLNEGETVVDEWLLSVSYYDVYGRAIQTISDNHLGGKDIVSLRINFTGDVKETKERHVVDNQETSINQRFEYDNAKRLKKVEHKVNGQNWITLSQLKYTELNQLSQKKLHGVGNSFVQSIDYRYNIRGWMTDMNHVDDVQTDMFAMHLDYTSAGEYSLFNGNISGMTWSSKMFSELKKYNFRYDKLNRLINADFDNNNAYTTSYLYNKNGNIELLTRNMMTESGLKEIDHLDYNYYGNQIKQIDDAEGTYYEQYGFKDNGISLPLEYNYDLNGNMIQDMNKGIENITYNQLNLPNEITIGVNESKKINYIYSANGSKLRKQTHENGTDAIKTDYSGAYIYEDDVLMFIQSPEGRLIPDGSGNFEYEYFLKDHLGNTRVMFSQTGKILQDQSYYPFGMTMGPVLTFQVEDQLPDNKYKYNGKELQDDFGLDWYDYGARMYDPSIGRWNGIDAHAENYLSLSPYHYGLNNPLLVIDPDGMDARGYDIDENRPSEVEGDYSSFSMDDEGNITLYGKSQNESKSNNKSNNQKETKKSTKPDRFGFKVTSLSEKKGQDTFGENVTGGSSSGGDAANGGGSDWTDRAGNILTTTGAIFGALKTTVTPGSSWLGNNGKYYSNSWGGNQYTGSRAGAFKAAGMYKMAGRANVAATVIVGGVSVYNGYQQDGGQFGYNANHAGASATGGLVIGFAGAKAGAAIGAGIGVWFGGVGAIPGAVIGGFIGGIAGSITGNYVGGTVVDYYYDR